MTPLSGLGRIRRRREDHTWRPTLGTLEDINPPLSGIGNLRLAVGVAGSKTRAVPKEEGLQGVGAIPECSVRASLHVWEREGGQSPHVKKSHFCQSEEKQTACVRTPRPAWPTVATPPCPEHICPASQELLPCRPSPVPCHLELGSGSGQGVSLVAEQSPPTRVPSASLYKFQGPSTLSQKQGKTQCCGGR